MQDPSPKNPAPLDPNTTLEELRALLYAPPSPSSWADLWGAFLAIEDPALLQLGLDYACDHLNAHRSAWRPAARSAPGAWVGALALDLREPRVALLRALDVERPESVWIPAGDFLMGSPTEEKHRDSDEARHPVRLTRSLIVWTTPVTQRQWLALMGSNPSHFQGEGCPGWEDHPVEQVNWFKAMDFCNALSRRDGLRPAYHKVAQSTQEYAFEGLGAEGWRLPTEAEWEYACRAGTQTSTYIGDVEILGGNNAPDLDPIAWYGGNSGVDYALGFDSSTWSEMHTPTPRSGTHPVALKQPNTWGLYDTLGNVWEWTGDRFDASLGRNAQEIAIDPTGPAEGGQLAKRGGSWYLHARFCRASHRGTREPTFSCNYLGLRPVRSHLR